MGSASAAAATLKLASPRRRSIHSARFTFDTDPPAALKPTSRTIEKTTSSPPTSPLWSSSTPMVADDDDLFTIFEQHRAAIPFKWEEFPGTPRDGAAAVIAAAGAPGEGLKHRGGGLVSVSEQECATASSASSVISRSSSSGISSSRSASQEGEEEEVEEVHDTIAEFKPTPIVRTSPSQIPPTTTKNAQELGVSKGSQQILPLKPPPGMNSIKQLLTLENDDRSIIASCFSASLMNNSSSIVSNSPKAHSRRSFRRDGLKALPFLSSTSPRMDCSEDFLTTMLGFEEWPKVVQQQEKQEKQQQDGEQHHRRATSMSRLSFSFRKKPEKKKENDDFLDADSIFNEDFGKKGGLRERRPLTSVSSRGLADGYSNFKSRSWVFDSDTDYSDSEMDTRSDYFDSSHIIAEEDEKDALKSNSDVAQPQPPMEKRKKHSRNPFTRVFGSHHHHHPKPSRLSSVSPAPTPTPPTPLSRSPETQGSRSSREVKQKDLTITTSTTSNPLLKMCLSTTIGQALLKNVRHLRSFEFHTPRSLTAK